MEDTGVKYLFVSIYCMIVAYSKNLPIVQFFLFGVE